MIELVRLRLVSSLQSMFGLAKGQYVTSHAHQFRVLLTRSFQEVTRDRLLTRLRLAAHVAMGVLIGLLWLNIGTSTTEQQLSADLSVRQSAQATSQNVAGYYFFSVLFLTLASTMPTVLTFTVEKEVFSREHLNNWYSVRSYYLAKSLADFPFQVSSYPSRHA